MSLVLTAMLARDYLGKYANIREAYSGYYDKSRDAALDVDNFSKPNTLRDSVRFCCDETIKNLVLGYPRRKGAKDMRAPIALFVYKTWGANEIFLKDCNLPVVKKIPKAPDLKVW